MRKLTVTAVFPILAIVVVIACSVVLSACSLFSDESSSSALSSEVLVTEVSLNKSEITLFYGESETLIATVLPANATNKEIIWSSASTDGIATVDQNGKVTAGTFEYNKWTWTWVYARAKDGGEYAQCKVNVGPVPVDQVTLNKNALSLMPGESETLTATVLPANAANKTITWESSTTRVTVADGLVTALSPGLATITVTTADGGKKAQCSVAVSARPITIDPIPDQIYTGNAIRPDITVRDGGAELMPTIDYTVAYLNNITAGTATVTITGQGSYVGSYGTTTFTILQPVSDERFEYYWVDEHGDLVTTSGGGAYADPGETLTITAMGDGYAVENWYLNGSDTDHRGTTYTFNSTVIGFHTVDLLVKKDGKLYSASITVNVTNLVTITFDPNGGSSSVPLVQKAPAGYTITLATANTLYYAGYNFASWNTQPSGYGGESYAAGSSFKVPDSDITLYARWGVLYEISFNINGGTGSTPTTQYGVATTAITLPFGNFSRTGYTFVGWIEGNSTVFYPAGASYIVYGNMTFYARWINLASGSLSAGSWSSGSISSMGGDQWFRFAAPAAGTNYIHFDTSGSMNACNVQVFDSSFNSLGSSVYLYSGRKYTTTPSLTRSVTYYLRVTPPSGTSTGTFRIAVSTSSTAPR